MLFFLCSIHVIRVYLCLYKDKCVGREGGTVYKHVYKYVYIFHTLYLTPIEDTHVFDLSAILLSRFDFVVIVAAGLATFIETLAGHCKRAYLIIKAIFTTTILVLYSCTKLGFKRNNAFWTNIIYTLSFLMCIT